MLILQQQQHQHQHQQPPAEPERLEISWHLNPYENEKPVTPGTPPVTPLTPVQSMAVLPFTGEKSSVLTVVFGFLMAFMGGAYLKRKTKDSKDM